MSFQKIKDKSIEKIFLEEKNRYKYALIFTLDKIYLDKMKEIDYSFDLNNFIEARFFDDKKELFVFYDGEKYKAVETDKSKWDEKDIIEREYILEKKYINEDYKKIKIIEFIAYDEDGQAYVKASCLNEIKGDKDE